MYRDRVHPTSAFIAIFLMVAEVSLLPVAISARTVLDGDSRYSAYPDCPIGRGGCTPQRTQPDLELVRTRQAALPIISTNQTGIRGPIMLQRTLPSSSRTVARSLSRARCVLPPTAATVGIARRSFASSSSSRLAEVQDAPQPKKRVYGGLRDQDRIFSNVGIVPSRAASRFY